MLRVPGWRPIAVVLLYACACLQFVRFYLRSTTAYLYLPAYLTGNERLPFQERILPALLLHRVYDSPRLAHLLAHSGDAANSQDGPLLLLGFCSLAAAAIFTQLLYSAVSRHRAFAPAVFPVFLFCVMWAYCIHSEANFSYPYDLPGLAFFTAGLYFIFTRRFVPLLLVMVTGSLNRETTLFLPLIYLLDSSCPPGEPSRRAVLDPPFIRAGAVVWLRVLLLFSIWAIIKGALAYLFRSNDASEQIVRFSSNLGLLRPRLFPALLNICGYLLPLVLLYVSRIRPRRFARYIWILVLWMPVMAWSGVLVETRIYGELCSWTAVAFILLIEDRTSLPAATA